MKIWEEQGRLELFAIKYRKDLCDIVRITHTVVQRDVWVAIFKRYEHMDEVKSEKIRAYLEYGKAVREKDYRRAYEIAVTHRLPFNLVRALPPSVWDERLLNTMSKLDLAMFSVPSVKRVPEIAEALAKVVERIDIPSWYSVRTLLASAIELGVEHTVTEAWGKVYTRSLTRTWTDLKVQGLDLERSSILVVLDASASMRPTTFTGLMMRGVSVLGPITMNVKGLIMFSISAEHEDPTMLRSLEGWLKLMDIARSRYDAGTNIQGALALALEDVRRGGYTDVILITDEQANIVQSGLRRTEWELIQDISKHANVILVDVAPYPVHIAKPLGDRVRYVYAKQAEDLLVSLILLRIARYREDEIRELMVKTVKATAQTT